MALTLNGTTGISGIAGSAGTPALQGNNDANTGYFFAADTLGLSTSGSERLRIDSSGRLLLGTTTIGQTGEADALTVYQSGHTGITIRTGGTSNNTAIYFADGTSGDQNYRGSITYTHSGDNLIFKTAGNNERLRIDSSGKVGIGTTNPSSIFHVRPLDETNFLVRNEGSTVVLASETNSGRDNNRGMALEATAFEFIEGGSEKMRIDSSGRVGIGTTSPSEILHINSGTSNGCLLLESTDAQADLYIKDNSGWGIISVNGDNLLFQNTSSQTERMRIASDGKVGIGTTSPGLKLHLQDGALSSAPTPNSNCDMVVEGTTNTGIQFLSSGQTQLRFGDAASTAAGAIIYNHSDDNFKLNYSNSGFLSFNNGSGEVARITSAGRIGIGTSTPTNKLDLAGDGDDSLRIKYTGTSGNHESCVYFTDKRDFTNAQISNVLRDDGSGTGAAGLYFRTSDSGNLAVRTWISRFGELQQKGTNNGYPSPTASIDINGGYLEIADDTSITMTSVANTGAIVDVGTYKRSGGSVTYANALFYVTYGTATVVKIADPRDIFANSDTDDKVCVFKGSNASGTFTIKNRMGVTNRISVSVIRTSGL
jgi:hypothetical protein